MRRTVIAMLVVGLYAQLASAQPAGRDKDAADAAYTEGQQHYAGGEFLRAAEQFEAAYALDPDPAYLFNIAQAYRLGNACAKAAAFYRQFLGAVSNPPNLAKVQQYIEQSDACARTQPPALDEPAPRVEPPSSARPIAPPEPSAPHDPGRTKRWIGIGTTAVGVMFVGLGVKFTGDVSGFEDEREALTAGCTPDRVPLCEWTPALEASAAAAEQSGASASRKAITMYTLGGVALAAGITLYVLGRSAESAPPIALVPTADGAMAVGAFTF